VTKMITMTLAVPNELKENRGSFPEMNWSEVARQAFIQKVADGNFKTFKEKSKLTEEDAMR
jgi:hypothetical protein